jgi:hypothetical protein
VDQRAEPDNVRCIFCLERNPPSGFSDEHVFPEALGGTVVIRNVCTRCNNKLGAEVDSAVTSHGLVEVKRHALGLAGKTGKVPNPLERATLEGDSERKVRYTPGPVGSGDSDVYLLPSVKKTIVAPGQANLSVRIDVRDLPRLGEIVNKSVQRSGGKPLTADEIAALKLNHQTLERPALNIPLSFDLSEYRRGLAKVAYELACHWLGDRYVDDPAAARLRDFIADSDLPLNFAEKHPNLGSFRMAPTKPVLPLWLEETPNSLMAYTTCDRDAIDLSVSVLGVLDGMIRITLAPGAYADPRQRFLCIDPQSGVTRERTLEHEVSERCAVFERTGKWPPGYAPGFHGRLWQSYSKKRKRS